MMRSNAKADPVGPVVAAPIGLTVVVLAVGVVLRLWQFLGHASLWVDELAVARNLADRSLSQLLTEPLEAFQAAPKGFLALEKLVVLTFGMDEWSLRLVPFVAGLAALPLLAVLGRQLELRVGVLIALALFALGVPFVRLGAQVKPYTLDVLATLVLMALAFRWRDRPHWGEALTLAGAGLVVVWFSFGSVLVLVGLGIGLGLCAFIDPPPRRQTRQLIVVVAAWLLAAAAGAAAGRLGQTRATHVYLYRFWADGFMPSVVHPGQVVRWLWRSFVNLIRGLLGYPWPIAYLALMVGGAVLIWRRRRDAAILLLAPVLAPLAAAALHRYPFADRLVLFAVPSLLLLIGEVGDCVLRLGPAPGGLRIVGVAAIMIGPLTTVWRLPPVYRPEDVRPVLAYMRSTWRPGDIAYVYYGARPGVNYYAPRLGFQPTDLLFGACHRGEPRRYLEELDGLRGRARAWVVITHAQPEFGERARILGYLKVIGSWRDSVGIAPPGVQPEGWASAYLFDLSDPRRLAAAAAATYAIVDSNGPVATMPCPEKVKVPALHP